MPGGIARLGSATGSKAAHGTVSVTDSPTPIPSTNLKDRKAISGRNWSDGTIVYIGNSDVTTANGFPLYQKESLPLDCSMRLQWYGICPTGETADCRYVEINSE